MWTHYNLRIMCASAVELSLIGLCVFMAAKFQIRSGSWRLFRRYAIVFPMSCAYVAYLVRPPGFPLSMWVGAYYSLLFSVVHVPVMFLLIDRKVLSWAVLGKPGRPPAIERMKITDIAVIVGLGAGGFALCAYMYYLGMSAMLELMNLPV